VRQTVEALWHGGHFVHRPEAAVTIWVFGARADYEAFRAKHAPSADPRWLSFYREEDRSIFFCAAGSDMGTLAHEVTHPLLEADLPRAAYWLTEGLPALFELPDFTDGIHGKAHFRLQTLRTALTKPEYAPFVRLDRLFTLADSNAFRDAKEPLNYAIAREFLRWLDAQDKLWEFYRAWREAILTDPTGEKSLAAAMGGKSPADLTPAWLDWLRSPGAE
jgi:hypothetical protein